MTNIPNLIARLKKAEFREPVELQEWYDIGADIRIEIRKQFSHVNLVKTEIIQALETQSKVIEKMREALEFYGERAFWSNDGSFFKKEDIESYEVYNFNRIETWKAAGKFARQVLKECEALEGGNE